MCDLQQLHTQRNVQERERILDEFIEEACEEYRRLQVCAPQILIDASQGQQ